MTGRTPSPPRSLIGRLLRRIAGLAGAILAACVLAVTVEWIGLTFFWSEQGAARSAAVLRQDLAWLASRAVEDPDMASATAGLAAQIASGLYRGLVVWTGIEALAGAAAGASALLADYLQGALNAVRTLFVRLAITVTALPLFALFAWWGAMEGLVRRDLRRFGGDIERGMVYHWAKHVAGAVLIAPVVLYLAWPDSVNPAWIFLPFAAALGINIMAVSATFTKHV